MALEKTAPDIAYNPADFQPHVGYAGVLAMLYGPELALKIEGIVPGGDQMLELLSTDAKRQGWPPPRVLRERRQQPAGNDLAGDESYPNGQLLYPDGAPRFQVLAVPGGNDQAFARNISHPRAIENIRRFVRAGGGYSGVCAGMCLATTGYHDDQGEPRDPDRAFANFTGLWPYHTLNLHGTRYIDFRFNPQLPPDHFLRRGFPEVLHQGRYNDGVAILKSEPHARDPHTEYILEHSGDPTTDGPKLDGSWATIAYIDPAHPRCGRMVLNGWHPESSTTPQHHAWFYRCVDYARERTINMPPPIQAILGKDTADPIALEKSIGDHQIHFYRLASAGYARKVQLQAPDGKANLFAARGRYPTPRHADLIAPAGYTQNIEILPDDNATPWVLAVQGTHGTLAGETYSLYIQ